MFLKRIESTTDKGMELGLDIISTKSFCPRSYIKEQNSPLPVLKQKLRQSFSKPTSSPSWGGVDRCLLSNTESKKQLM